MKRELVCIQAGTLANHVGAHVWNLRDEYLAVPPSQRELSPAAFFRSVSPGTLAARRGLRYAPRLQVIDATGAFGALSTQAGSVLPVRDLRAARDLPPDGERVTRYVRAPVPRSRYVQGLLASEEGTPAVHRNEGADECTGLEDGVGFWSDFLKTRLHPRTCFALPGVHHSVAKLGRFEAGEEIAKASLLEEAYDDLRFFVEECDSFGGLCVTANSDDAYAGFTAKYLSYLYEELGASSPVLVFGVHDVKRTYSRASAHALGSPFDAQFEGICARNEAKLAATCLEFSAEYAPLSAQPTYRVPLLHTKKADVFQSSAVMSLALDVSLIPLQQNLSLAGLLSAVRPTPFACFGSVACNFPSASSKLTYGSNLLDTIGSSSLSNLWNEAHAANQVRPAKEGGEARSSRCTEIVSARGLEYSVPVFSNVACPITIPVPFPSIFDSSLERNRYAATPTAPRSKNDNGPTVEQIAMLAGLATVASHGQSGLTVLGEAVKPTKRSGLAFSADVEEAELRETAEALVARAEDYSSL